MKKVKLSEIPVIPKTVSNFIDLALKVKANGADAKIFISSPGQTSFNGDEKIVILFDEPNQQFGDSFTTKYFDMPEPGVLTWGHDGGTITLEK